jgi:hypothetical protein
MHGMPETVRATPPSLFYLRLDRARSPPRRAHRKVCATRCFGAVARLSPQAKSVVRSRPILCVFFVFSFRYIHVIGGACSLYLSSLYISLYSALLCSELLMRVLTRTEHHDWTRLSVQAPSRKVSTSVRHRRGRQLATLRTMSGTMQSHLLAALSCLR